MIVNLLTWNQTKTNKSRGFGYMTGILHLAPYTLSGRNVCPYASKGCAEACLNTAGRGIFQNVQDARIRKTEYLFEDRNAFIRQIKAEIGLGLRRAKKAGLKLAIRLNGTSDIPWENVAPSIFEHFQDVQFYDYTKQFPRLLTNTFENYDLTFSRSEDNANFANMALNANRRIAVVFRNELPETFNTFPVVDGDIHDLTFLHPRNCVIGLRAKGKAKKDTTGFVI